MIAIASTPSAADPTSKPRFFSVIDTILQTVGLSSTMSTLGGLPSFDSSTASTEAWDGTGPASTGDDASSTAGEEAGISTGGAARFVGVIVSKSESLPLAGAFSMNSCGSVAPNGVTSSPDGGRRDPSLPTV